MEDKSNICKDSEKVKSILLRRENASFLPTPLHKLKNLSTALNFPNIYVKRDDMTGLALGGNKVRKLEYVIWDALDKKCDTIITFGAFQSNSCRQTAAICALYNLKCYLFLVGDESKLTDTGNVLLDKILKAEIIITKTKQEADEKMKTLVEELKSDGKSPYYVPLGGSYDVGLNGYISAYIEILEDEKRLGVNFDYIFFGSSSYGTHAGLLIGNKLFGENKKKIYGISIDKNYIKSHNEELTENKILSLVKDYNNLYGCSIEVTLDDVILDQRFSECGYANLSEADKKAIDLFAQHEAIILDPVYSGRAAGGMIKMLEWEEIPKDANILFIHTGGAPAVFTSLFDLNAYKK